MVSQEREAKAAAGDGDVARDAEEPSGDAEKTSGAAVDQPASGAAEEPAGAADAAATQGEGAVEAGDGDGDAAADAAAEGPAEPPVGEAAEPSAAAAESPSEAAEPSAAAAESPGDEATEPLAAAAEPPGEAAEPSAAAAEEEPPAAAEEPSGDAEEPSGDAEEPSAPVDQAAELAAAEAAAAEERAAAEAAAAANDPRNKYGHGWLTALPDPDAPPEPEVVEVVEEVPEESEESEPPEPEPEEVEEPEEDYNELILVTDREAALAAVRENGFALRVLPDAFRCDKEVALAAVRQNPLALKCALPESRGDLEVVKAALTVALASGSGGAAMPAVSHATEELLADKAAMLVLAAMDGEVLQFASDELKADREVVLAAVTNKHWSLQYASETQSNDPAFMLEAVSHHQRNARALRYAGRKARGNKELAMTCVKIYPFALESASMALRDDDEVVLSACRTNGLALQFASIRLRGDKRIAMEALLNSPQSWRFASRRLHADPEAMAAQGLEGTEAAILRDKNAKSAAAKITTTEDGFVEYRQPWVACWPIVIVAPYGGEERPDRDPVTKGPLPDRSAWSKELNPSLKTWELSEEVWEAFVVGSPGPPAMVRMKLGQQKMDADAPRRESCDGVEAALRAYDCYHGWVEEALEACVKHFGFALLLDVRGQNHRRGVTEMSYLLTPEDLQLFNNVIDIAPPRATSIDAFFRQPAPPKGRPGGMSELLRGKNSLAHQLERNGLKCVPCPRRPEPVDEMTLAKKNGGVVLEFAEEKQAWAPEVVETYLDGGYTLRRYAAAHTVSDGPLPAAHQDSWARSVAGVQVNACWDSRKDRLERQRFGHVMMGAVELVLRVWLGFAPSVEK